MLIDQTFWKHDDLKEEVIPIKAGISEQSPAMTYK